MLPPILILAILLLPACHEESPFSQKGRELIAAEKWPEVQAHYQKDKVDKSHVVARQHALTLADLYLGKEVIEAENIQEQIFPPAASDADKALFYYDVGNYFLSHGKAKEAITFYEKSLILKPAFALAAHNLQLALLLKTKDAPGKGKEGQKSEPQEGENQKVPRVAKESPKDPQNQKEQPGDSRESAKIQLTGPANKQRTGIQKQKSLKERLELLLGREEVLILTPRANQRKQGTTLYPNW